MKTFLPLKNTFQFLPKDPEALQNQMGRRTPEAIAGSIPSWAYPADLQRETARRHPNQMSKLAIRLVHLCVVVLPVSGSSSAAG